MFKFIKDSEASIVFAENVTREAIETAMRDLQSIGYAVKHCKLSCEQLGADHLRVRYWLVATNDKEKLQKISSQQNKLPKLKAICWQTTQTLQLKKSANPYKKEPYFTTLE